ncbi:MAG: DegV family protein [Desulfitobacterium hafniense]|nr:DegV family protein [Desulfitobacterium hafniense]
MIKTAIVMDSTGYLTPDILDQYGIRVVPLNVTIGNETFPETELTNTDLFNKLDQISGISTTSQPSVGLFLSTYDKLFNEGYEEIVSIHLSQKISGTFISAQMAKDLSTNKKIHIFDSGSAASGLGLLAWAAGEWAQDGLSGEEIIRKLAKLKSVTELYFMVDTLEYLRRGGRIGGASALVGTLLQIKPILYLNSNGEIDVYEKVRSKGRAWQRVLSELSRAISTGDNYRIAVLHVRHFEEGQKVLQELKIQYPMHEIRLFEPGPVIATHVGPGTLGLAFHPWPLKTK